MNGKMKAIVKTEAKKGAELQEVPIPECGPEQVLVEVETTSICGTDLHIYEWNNWAEQNINPPQIMGHEVAGEVIEVGERVEAVEKGDFISAETHIPCGHCYQCKTGKEHICDNMQILGVDKDGVFAEYAVIDEVDVWKNSPQISAEYAPLQEPMGNAIDTILAGDVAGKNILITGAGPAGLIAVGVARAFGATKIIVSEPNDYRRDIALEMGADKVVNPLEEDLEKIVLAETNDIGVDFVAEMSGNEMALNQSLKLITAGGRMGLLGLPDDDVSLDLNSDVIFKGITLVGVTGRQMFDTWFTAKRLLESGRVDLDPVITHTFPLEEFEKGMKLMEDGNCGKIILKP